ncbi:MAG TPA: hypothetical protein VIG94_10220 [Faecalibacter sp.]
MKKSFLFLSVCAFATCQNVSAQVGIGTSEPKSSLHIVGQSNLSNVADGVIAPRISKQNLANKANGVYTLDHVGSVVYVDTITTVNSGPSLSQVSNIKTLGYYYFDGQRWQPIAGDTTNDAWINNETNNRVELATTSKGEARSTNTNLYIQDAGNVGVGTQAPSAKLHVNGNLKIETMDTYNADVAKPVYWNPETKSLSTTLVQRPFYNFKYKLRASKNEDWINNFNTLIDATKYTVIITSAVLRQSNINGDTFNTNEANAYINLFNVNSGSNNANDLKQVLPNIAPFIENNTWRIRADFVNTAPYRANTSVDSYFLWEIDVLVINNNSINTLDVQLHKLDSSSGTATQNPIPPSVTTP